MADESATKSKIDKHLVILRTDCHHGLMASRCARLRNLFVLAALAVLLGGCFGGGHAVGSPDHPTIPVGKSSQSIEWAGASRTFNLYRPQGLTGAAPLVVMLHGGYGDGAQAERSYHWDTEADKGHFLVAYPDGQGRAWNAVPAAAIRPRPISMTSGSSPPSSLPSKARRPSMRRGCTSPACRTGP